MNSLHFDCSFLLYDHILEVMFHTPNDDLRDEIDACYEINSTCGVDIETLKRLVGVVNEPIDYVNLSRN